MPHLDSMPVDLLRVFGSDEVLFLRCLYALHSSPWLQVRITLLAQYWILPQRKESDFPLCNRPMCCFEFRDVVVSQPTCKV